MIKQSVEYIELTSLVLWTENPRDPIDESTSNQEIVNRALEDSRDKWRLKKLASEMGTVYDQSELPTVVMHGDVPVVYDGNRRVILGLLAKQVVAGWENLEFPLPEYPDFLPCNFCERKLALQHVYRKHYDSGSWAPLERDIFLNRHLGEDKTTFLIFEEETGLISSRPELNVGFVKKEVLTEERLNKLGFSVSNGELRAKHDPAESTEILDDLFGKVKVKAISTRNNRGDVYGILDPVNQDIVDRNAEKQLTPISLPSSRSIGEDAESNRTKKKKRTRRKNPTHHDFFGGGLYLVYGEVSDLYRDLEDLFHYYRKNSSQLSSKFPALIRMGLRLLIDTAAEGDIEGYVKAHFDKAKKHLSKDQKTTLSSQRVSKENLVQLLHIGAHRYSAAADLSQTIAISLIVGGMLQVSHGKGDEA